MAYKCPDCNTERAWKSDYSADPSDPSKCGRAGGYGLMYCCKCLTGKGATWHTWCTQCNARKSAGGFQAAAAKRAEEERAAA
eukprot:CAMPEP_0172204398 /NCGR_PEP_ID=MMETSP1050-20130122/31924_1 /TAXON_ID=233186 /ORGANISM="Cryptomonas curvata, Strain CCAP979/52" /LENGTH=81 /DNA_ID=CAMNT_0012882933 /DNA_START=1 /DNA_END=243 /DNA_ORIENTATION=-